MMKQDTAAGSSYCIVRLKLLSKTGRLVSASPMKSDLAKPHFGFHYV
jgi:hypothetical protein